VGIFADRKLLEKAEKELNTEFIPDLYDKTMDAIFDDKYYNSTNNDGKELENNKDIDI
jgi:KRI1-like family